MKQVLTSILVLFITFSCQIRRPTQDDITLYYSLGDEAFLIRGEVHNEYADEYEYGLIYKLNPSKEERDNFIISENVNKERLQLTEEDEFHFSLSTKDFSFSNFINPFIFRTYVIDNSGEVFYSKEINNIILYDLALNTNSDYATYIVNTVYKNSVIIEEIEIFTDANKEYEVSSHSEGINVSMSYDYKYIVLTVDLLDGYMFSKDLLKEDITIHIVSDDVIVEDFTIEVTNKQIIITYDDHGWGPPM